MSKNTGSDNLEGNLRLKKVFYFLPPTKIVFCGKKNNLNFLILVSTGVNMNLKDDNEFSCSGSRNIVNNKIDFKAVWTPKSLSPAWD